MFNKRNTKLIAGLLALAMTAAWMGCSKDDVEDIVEKAKSKADKLAGKEKSERNENAGENPEIHLQCLSAECGATLVRKYKDFTDKERQALLAPPGPERPMCQKCHVAMGRQVQCPSCQKWYLDPMETHGSPTTKNICPHCNTDVVEFWRKKSTAQ